MARGQHDLNRGPSVADVGRELEAVLAVRHVDIAEHKADIFSLFQYVDGFVRISGLDHVEPGIFQHRRRANA